MARKPTRNGTGLEHLIEQSVAQALTTWLSLRAMKIADDVLADAFTDEQFRQDFVRAARRVAQETLERLGRRSG